MRLGSLGDLVHTIPAVTALRASFPAARIDWVVERKWSPLIELVTGVDTVIALERTVAGNLRCVRGLRRAGYSCAIDFQGLCKSALLGWCAGSARRIGFDRSAAREPGAACFYNEPVEKPAGRHVAEMNLGLAVHAGAEKPSQMQFPLRVPESAVNKVRERLRQEGIGPYVVASPGGGWKSKCWPPDRYGALCADLWRRHNLRAIVNTAPGEEALTLETIRGAMPAQPLPLSLPLPELAALLAGARLVIAADSGTLHLAAALDTRVVGLFGPTDPARNGPLPRGTVVRNATSQATTYLRGRVHSPAMLSLTVEQVLETVEREMSVAA